MVQWKQIRLVSMQMWVTTLASISGLRIPCCRECGVGHRCSLDLPLLWLWLWPAAVAPVGPLAWEPPEATPVALKSGPGNGEFDKGLRRLDLQVWKPLSSSGARKPATVKSPLLQPLSGALTE